MSRLMLNAERHTFPLYRYVEIPSKTFLIAQFDSFRESHLLKCCSCETVRDSMNSMDLASFADRRKECQSARLRVNRASAILLERWLSGIGCAGQGSIFVARFNEPIIRPGRVETANEWSRQIGLLSPLFNT
jgi:hypothetical protein